MTIVLRDVGNINYYTTKDVVKINKSNKFEVFDLVDNSVVLLNKIRRRNDLDNRSVENLYNKIINSETRINFDGRFIENILKNGYKHWSSLKTSKNTQSITLFIQRMQSEYKLFGINVYNDNVLDRINELLEKEGQEKFIRLWDEYFETDFSQQYGISINEILYNTGFTKESLPREVIFGALYHNNELISVGDHKKSNFEKHYCKSQLVLNDIAREKSTYCLGDTFDATEDGYYWKENSHVLFTLNNKENVVNRLKSIIDPEASIPYIENHIFERVTSEHISKIILDRSELVDHTDSDFADLCKKLKKTYKVAIEVINSNDDNQKS